MLTEDFCKVLRECVEKLTHKVQTIPVGSIDIGVFTIDAESGVYAPSYFTIKDSTKEVSEFDCSLLSFTYFGSRMYKYYIGNLYFEYSTLSNTDTVAWAYPYDRPHYDYPVLNYRDNFEESYFQHLLSFPGSEEDYDGFVLGQYVIDAIPKDCSLTINRDVLSNDSLYRLYEALK